MRYFFALTVLIAVPVLAQVRPLPVGADPMQQSVRYVDGQTVVLEVAPGFQLTVELGEGETISNAVSGDLTRWQVLASTGASQFFVRPAPQAPSTNLTVITNRHRHYFLLIPAEKMTSELPVSVRIDDPQPARLTDASPQPLQPPVDPSGVYKLSGSKLLMPSIIWDDGRKTYLDWPENVELPAVFAIGPDGKEMLVNGYMRDGRFVIDMVYGMLLFRLDHEQARAQRREEKRS